MINSADIIKQLEKRLGDVSQNSKTTHTGIVEKNSDGVVIASGLSDVTMGEMVEFDNSSRGVVFNLTPDSVSIILLNSKGDIKEGDKMKRTNELLSIQVSEELLGRVVDPIGNPLDGKPVIKKGKTMPLKKIAAGVTARQPVDTPLKTGIKAIDAMIPVGLGQRELIIGDRGLGKTAIALDTIINQRADEKSKNKKQVICIYVAIGQKQSSVSQVIDRLKQANAFDYTIVVSATAADPASRQ